MLVTNKEDLSAALSGGYAVGAFNPRKILGSAKEYMKKVVKEKMRLFGSVQKAV
jgi:fructose/tagatose bisphosphate aldolase